MTAPRQVLPNATLMISRRCLGRMFLLKPTQYSNQLFGFLLAVAARRHAIQVHCFCVLSNHVHLVVTDPFANSPAFMRDLCAFVARSLNLFHRRAENFWAPGSYSAVRLASPSDILDKMAYALANPAAAGLVPRCSEWPGLWSAPQRIGGAPYRFPRPGQFFREDGPLPDFAELQLVCPPGFESVESFRSMLAAKLSSLEEQAICEHQQKGWPFLGLRKILSQSPHGRPVSPETRRKLNPRIAARDKWKRFELIQYLKKFLNAYRAAWRAFTEGDRDVVFPYGTYLMRVQYRACCVAPA